MLRAFKQKNRKSLASFSEKQLKERGLTLYNFQALNQKINTQNQRSKQFIDQLKIDKLAVKKINKTVEDKFFKVEKDVIHLASKLEQEKHKNQLLQKLVKHFENQINWQKKQRSFQNKQSGQFQSISHKLKQTQRQYEHYTLRKNSSSYQVRKKIDQIRTLRSERAVLNGVFDQFQKQIFVHQHNYRTLMIERTALLKIYQQKIVQLQKISETTQKQYEKFHQKTFLEAQKSNIQQNNLGYLYNSYPSTEMEIKEQSMQLPSTIREDQRSKSKRLINSRRYAMEISQSVRNNTQLRKLKYKKALNKILIDLHLTDLSQIFIDPQQLQSQIQKLYQQANALYQQIYQKQMIVESQQKAKHNNIQCNLKRIQQKNIKVKKINNLEAQLQQTQTQLQNFLSKACSQLILAAGQCPSIDKTNQQQQVLDMYDRLLGESDKITKSIIKWNKDKLFEINEQINQTKIDKQEQISKEQLQGKLNKILNAHKTTKNTMRIYTEEQFIEISKYNLQNQPETQKQKPCNNRSSLV